MRLNTMIVINKDKEQFPVTHYLFAAVAVQNRG